MGADYSQFDPTIIPWLDKVWDNKQLIEATVRETEDLPRKEGAWEVYRLYNDPVGNKVSSNEFHMKLRRLHWFFGIPICIAKHGTSIPLFEDKRRGVSAEGQETITANDFFHFVGHGTGLLQSVC